MYASVEGRVPLLDRQVVEYTWNIPSELTRVEGVEKSLVRRALADILPPAVLSRAKCAWPWHDSPRYAEALRDLARDVLADPNSPALPLFDRTRIEERCERPTEGDEISGLNLVLERLIQVDAWLREYRVELV